jgi:glycosyltransferase involved in cell wall biosynthesis
MSKSVLHVVGLSGYGGLEQLFVAYIGAMTATHRAPAVIIKQSVHPDFRGRLRAYSGTVYGQKYWGPVRLPGLGVARGFNLRRILRATSADKVVFWSSLPTQDWIRACQRSDAQIVYYDHGRAWQLPRASDGGALSHADAAISVSQAGRRILRERLGFSRRIDVVPNGVRFPASGSPPHKVAGGPLRIGFAGRLIDKKGVPVLLWAARKLTERGVDFELAIAGDGPRRSALMELTQRLDLSARVHFLGEVRDMPGFYRGIDLLAMPSVQEAFGLTSLEAAAHGVPVVISRVDGLPGTIREGETGFSLPATLPMETYMNLGVGHFEVSEQVYDPDSDRLRAPAIVDPDALADLLSDLAPQPERLRAMGQQGARYVQAEFSMAGYVERLNAVLGI